MKRQYIYDKESFRFKKSGKNVAGILGRILKYFIASVSLAVLYYIVFALFINTDTERKLQNENDMFETIYPDMKAKEELLSDVVEGLKVKDNEIYNGIFHSPAPYSGDFFLEGLIAEEDSVRDADMVAFSAARLELMEKMTDRVEANFREIYALLGDDGAAVPPLFLPLTDFTPARTGASVGNKMNPFYKVGAYHSGLDIVAHAGDSVVAAADGIVSKVIRSRKGQGNVVVIDHGNGYSTKYAHLEDIRTAAGRKVVRGSLVGHVGVSGNSFAPHLHYEVIKDTVSLDPLHYFFGSVDPYRYADMLYYSVTTGQSMD